MMIPFPFCTVLLSYHILLKNAIGYEKIFKNSFRFLPFFDFFIFLPLFEPRFIPETSKGRFQNRPFSFPCLLGF